MLTAKEIRESFKDFFRERGHQIVPSAPMVIKDDQILSWEMFRQNISGSRIHKNV